MNPPVILFINVTEGLYSVIIKPKQKNPIVIKIVMIIM